MDIFRIQCQGQGHEAPEDSKLVISKVTILPVAGFSDANFPLYLIFPVTIDHFTSDRGSCDHMLSYLATCDRVS